MSHLDERVPLTAAAAQAMEELVADVRSDLLRRARQSAEESQGGLAREITVRDVMSAAEMPEYAWQHLQGGDRLGLLLRIYSVVFGVAALIGIALWFAPNLENLQTQQLVGVATAITGLLGAALSWFYGDLIRRRRSSSRGGGSGGEARDIQSHFLASYVALELSLRDFNARHLGETAAAATNPVLVARRSDVLGDEDRETLRSIVDLRNRMVHGKLVTTPELTRGILEANRLRASVSKRD
ncbi:hypothetical protein ACOCJ7_00100 [Knoellia sp. CPCC 206453]|uniref:hypothetical protein n=1 Tax=Knoellia pratensis TaxID=3404796 RepID=UPI003609AF2D